MLTILRKTWGLLEANERRRSLCMLMLAVLMAIVETAGVLSIMPFLSVLGRPDVIIENSWLLTLYESSGARDTRDFTIALGLGSAAIIILAAVFKVMTQHSINRFIHMLRHSISSRLLEKYLRQPYTFFLARNTADLSKNILSETDQLLHNLIQPLSQLIAQGAIVLAMVILVVLYDPLMATAVVAVIGGLYASIYSAVRKRMSRIGSERITANRERYQASNEALTGIKDVKITQSAANYLSRFSHASHNYSRHLAASDTLSQTPLYLVEAAGYSGLILIALILLLRSGDIAQVLPALGLYGFAAYRMLPAAQIIYRGFAKLKFSAPAMDAIHRDLTLQEELHVGTGRTITPTSSIQLDNVSFSYHPPAGKPAVENFSLLIPANTSIGIVGRSGAGKSTLMDILMGLLRPQKGSLRVDEMVIDDQAIFDWQRSIGYVPQQIFLSDASVAENIAFGVLPEDIDMAMVRQAAQLAQIDEFVETELPDGYTTRVGDRGLRLSGGQRQRIGVARALYSDPPVLFFDEATSALDHGTETALSEAIKSLGGKKTIVVIAHRRESLKYCDEVIHVS